MHSRPLLELFLVSPYFYLALKWFCDISNSFIIKSTGSPLLVRLQLCQQGRALGFRNEAASSEREGGREALGAGPAWLQV